MVGKFINFLQNKKIQDVLSLEFIVRLISVVMKILSRRDQSRNY